MSARQHSREQVTEVVEIYLPRPARPSVGAYYLGLLSLLLPWVALVGLMAMMRQYPAGVPLPDNLKLVMMAGLFILGHALAFEVFGIVMGLVCIIQGRTVRGLIVVVLAAPCALLAYKLGEMGFGAMLGQ